MALESENLG
jgi:hypothetical protein